MRFKAGKIIKEFQKGGKRVVFRYLKPSDAEQALEFINSMIRERAKIQWQKPFTMEKEREWLRDAIEKSRNGMGVYVVVEIDGNFAGNGVIKKMPGQAVEHIGEIGISLSKEHRGLGIGKELMKTLCQLGRDMLKCSIAILIVYTINKNAIHLYKKTGFREFGRLPNGANYYGEYQDVIYMYKEMGK